MNATEAMKRLESLGNAQARSTYARHGIEGKAFGVRYGDLARLVKQIGTNHALAERLWATGNHDARILATMIADPAQVKATTLDAWAKVVNNQLMLDAVAALTAKTTHATKRLAKWVASRQEWIAATGWHLLAALAGRPEGDLDDGAFAAYLDHIEARIHDSPNRVRHSMNTALISIGVRNADLQRKALATAKRIGTVEVDHGDTACKTPDAAAYIRKTMEHRARRKGASTAPAAKSTAARRAASKKAPAQRAPSRKKTGGTTASRGRRG